MRRLILAVTFGFSALSGCVSPGHHCPCDTKDAPPAALMIKPEFIQGEVRGLIPVLAVNDGNVWTNIPKTLVDSSFPNHKTFLVKVFNGTKKVYEARLPLGETLAAAPKGKPLLYFNSLMNLSLALNEDDFAKRFKVQSGPDWLIVITL